MKKISLSEAQSVPFDLDGRFLFRSSNNEIVHLTLKAGEVIPEHSNPFDVVFFIIEGSATLKTDNQSESLIANDSVYINRNEKRALFNPTDKIVRLLVFKMM